MKLADIKAPVTLASLLLAASCGVAAQEYPVRTLRWIVPYPPGGYADSVTRTLVPRLQDALGQAVVVENKPGANSMLGAEMVARSAPDGYTLLSVIVGHAANATLYADRLTFHPIRSFAPVSLVAIAPLLLAVNKDLPVRDVNELLIYARANPGKLSYGSSGIGAGAHLTMELFRLGENLDIVHVPYKGGAPAVQALVSGEIQLLADVPTVLMPQVRSGRVRALGVFAAKRVSGLEDIPTIGEGATRTVEGATWVMVLLPAGTPASIVARLSNALRAIVADNVVQERFRQLGTTPVGTNSEDAGKFLADEVNKWRDVINRSGIKAE